MTDTPLHTEQLLARINELTQEVNEQALEIEKLTGDFPCCSNDGTWETMYTDVLRRHRDSSLEIDRLRVENTKLKKELKASRERLDSMTRVTTEAQHHDTQRIQTHKHALNALTALL